MDQVSRWVVALVAAAAIVVLILFARGAPERGGPDTSPTAAVAEQAA
jgi:hypothetical protein